MAPSGEGIELTSVGTDAKQISGDTRPAATTGAGETAAPPTGNSHQDPPQPERDEGMRKRRGWCFKKQDEDEDEEEKEPLMASQEDDENQDLKEFIATVKEASGNEKLSQMEGA